jgi:hypothetical protein
VRNGNLEYREIRHEGIRCVLRWGSDETSRKAGTSTLDDVESARRHAARKINEWAGQGFVEVDLPCDGSTDEVANAPVLEVIESSAGPHAPRPVHLPVDGFDDVYRRELAVDRPRDSCRSALSTHGAA